MDSNNVLRQRNREFRVQLIDTPSPEEAFKVLDFYKQALESKGIKSPRFCEITFDPLARRFCIIARRDSEDDVTKPLLEILQSFPFTCDDDDDDDGNRALDIIKYKDSFLPGAFLKWPASGVYTGLREEEGTTFTYVTILRHFGVDNRHFKTFLASSLRCALQIGTSWDAKLLYVGAPDQRTVDMVIDVFHGLRVQMMRDLVKCQDMAKMHWDFEHHRGEDLGAGLRQWVAGLENADTASASEPSEEDLQALWDDKGEEEEDLIQL
ncbi:hypothetical protein F5X68DRAFT_242796 [Plectosphaerella plurivora]|uniref:Uncharacterized protein n=1 Tax=Plectosphaerella plurivora TaxID=936078 RepID=A0A9P8V8Q7_9PEZI|nr:hypothetical protein F5X68DRAFT_242796 [Plectosphaerella plurivora]